jgi:hypothetical protein
VPVERAVDVADPDRDPSRTPPRMSSSPVVSACYDPTLEFRAAADGSLGRHAHLTVPVGAIVVAIAIDIVPDAERDLVDSSVLMAEPTAPGAGYQTGYRYPDVDQTRTVGAIPASSPRS